MRRRSLIATLPALLAAPHVARAQARQIKFGHNNTTNSLIHAGATAFAEAVASASGGRLTVDIHPNSTLGSEAQMVANVAAGSLDMTLAPLGSIAGLAPEIALTELPYLFRGVAEARAAYDGRLGQHCAALLAAKEVQALGFGEIGLRHISANRPIPTPDALRGLRIRVPVSPAILEGFRALGAEAAILPFPQLPDALRSGQFEAQENPINIFIAAELHRFQSHITLTGHVYGTLAFLMAGDSWDELDADGKAMVRAAARAGSAATRRFADASEAQAVATLRATGTTIVDGIDRGAFQRAVEANQAQMASVFGAEPIARIRGLVG